jgi:NAD(P)-dependent dehydrogenase (short-subunit alcohol dehydrogenase family)
VTEDVHNDTYPAIDPTQHDLTGKAVFISGATRGIGRATSVSFAKAGASLIAIGARSDLTATKDAVKEAAKAAGQPEPQILQLKLDVSSPRSVSEAVAEVEKTFGRLDILVNNAGVISMALIADSKPEEWWRNYEVNVKGPYLTSRACLPLLLKSENGLKQILTVSR